MIKKGISEAQYVITNQCSLAKQSNYCVVPESKLKEPTDWRIRAKAIKALYDRGVRVLKFLGGEPFDTPGIEKIIEYTNSLKGLDYAVTTNGIEIEKIEKINNNIGLKGVFVSIDSLNELSPSKKAVELWGCSTIKSKQGIKLLRKLKGKVKFLGANTIVHRGNLDQLPEILKFLTSLGAVMNICPLIWGKGRFVYRTSDRPDAALGEKDRSKVIKVMKQLVSMKKKGYNLACPDQYALDLAQYSIPKMSWNCSKINKIPVVRVGADLKLMVCSDIIGKNVSKFTVFDLKDRYEEIISAWKNDPDRKWCCTSKKGNCYWSNIVRGEFNKKIGGSLTK